MNDLTGKLILVSGGSRDIGRSIVLHLASLGAHVAFTFHATQPDETHARASSLPGKLWSARCDMTSSAQVKSFVAAALAHFKLPISGLVNNAGGLIARKKILEQDEAFWDQILSLNTKSAFFFTQAALPHMQPPAAIVTIASQAGRDGGGAGASAYAASKGALMAWTRAMAKELGPQNIRTNCLCPGLIGTGFHDTFTSPDVRKRVAESTPLKREGHPDEVASATSFLLSADSSFLNGVAMDINGGLAFS